MKILSYILACSLLVSCSQKWCACHYPPLVKDSLINTITVDTFYIPVDPDTTYYHVPFNPCDSVKQSTLLQTSNHNKALEITYSNQMLNVKQIQGKDSLPVTREMHNIKDVKTLTVPQPVIIYKAPKWAWWLLGIDIFILLVIIVRLSFKVTH